MTTARRLNLTAALSVVAVADLVLHRLIERLFLSQHPTGIARLCAEGGRFAFHLGGVLGLALVAATLYDNLRRTDLFPRSMRFAIASTGVFFLVTSAAAVLALEITERYVDSTVQLIKTTHSLLALGIALALWRTPGSVRARVGVTLFALPSTLHAIALLCNRLGWGRLFPSELARTAEICALAAGALSPLLLTPDSTSGKRGLLGAIVGVLTLGGLLAALVTRFDLVQMLALYGFRLDLPQLATPGAITYVAMVIAAFVGLAVSIVWNLSERAGARLVGYGLVLLACAGYQTVAPNQLLFATCGLLALAQGTLHPAREPAPLVSAAAAGL
jgi:tryptophan-rich sensory protein